jgi:hypothetical protein
METCTGFRDFDGNKITCFPDYRITHFNMIDTHWPNRVIFEKLLIVSKQELESWSFDSCE